ncbi:MAG: hypothetical protein WA705_19470 [Candidatus Ozemobacteraceae bacterium]
MLCRLSQISRAILPDAVLPLAELLAAIFEMPSDAGRERPPRTVGDTPCHERGRCLRSWSFPRPDHLDQQFPDPFHRLGCQVRVDCGGGGITMAQKTLNRTKIQPRLQQMCGNRMATMSHAE